MGPWNDANSWRPPDPDTLDVWRIGLRVSTPRDRACLSRDEQARADRLLIEEKRHHYIVARSQLRHVLSRYLDPEPSDLRFDYGEYGRPELPDAHPWVFNLSHSNQLALLSVARDVRLGIDIEFAERQRRFDSLADFSFSERECHVFHALPPAEQPQAFYRLWTRKEAYLKAWGTGLSFRSDRMTLTMDEDPRLLDTEMPGDDLRHWHFHDLAAAENYEACVCWKGRALDIRLWDADN